MKKSINYIIVTIALVAIGYTSNAQSVKLQTALNEMVTTDFIYRFDSVATIIETDAKVIKNASKLFTDKEKVELSAAYNSSAKKFNNILNEMKNDFLDKKQLKLMLLSPNTYSDSYSLKLRDADNYYKQNYLRMRNSLYDSNAIDAIGLPALIAIFETAMEIVNAVKEYKKMVRKFTDDLLNKNFVEPHRIKMWEEL